MSQEACTRAISPLVALANVLQSNLHLSCERTMEMSKRTSAKFLKRGYPHPLEKKQMRKAKSQFLGSRRYAGLEPRLTTVTLQVAVHLCSEIRYCLSLISYSVQEDIVSVPCVSLLLPLSLSGPVSVMLTASNLCLTPEGEYPVSFCFLIFRAILLPSSLTPVIPGRFCWFCLVV